MGIQRKSISSRHAAAARLQRASRTVVESLEGRVLLAGEPYMLPQYALANLGSYLSPKSTQSPLTIATTYLTANADDLGLVVDDLKDFAITNQYTDPDTGTTHIYLRQTYGGLEVANANLSVNVAKDGRIINIGGGFVPSIYSARINSQLTLDASDALIASADDLSLELTEDPDVIKQPVGVQQKQVLESDEASEDPIPAKLQYVATAEGLTLAWDMILRTPDGEHWYDVSTAAGTGKIVAFYDWVENAAYNVYPQPMESPYDGSRITLIDSHDSVASPFGWHDTNGAPGAEFTDTRGNNVSAQEDTNADNSGGFRPDGGPSLNFDYPIDLTLAPSGYQSAAITNLFYWNNLLHDIHYKYGFTEAAGNFQVNNYGKGGAGSDAVQADAQDGSGTNNANFATPPDGSQPRMQMYIFTAPTPDRDGDLDNGIIVHEYGHGVSNRLTGGPANSNALSAIQSGGMGEGWSDWWALMLTQKPTDVKDQAYPIGTYALGQASTGQGIRRQPYSYNMAIDPITFSAFNSSSQVHNTGEIWASALWDMAWLLVDKYGFSENLAGGYSPGGAGNLLALKLVMDGLKLQPANPRFTDARDAILQADTALTGGANLQEIWTAFARRGLGLNANCGPTANTTSITVAFDMPILGLQVNTTTPVVGSVVTSLPTEFTLNFSAAYTPATVAAGDFQVNGTPANSFTLIDSDTIRFTFNTTPVSTQGQQTMSMAAGAMTKLSDSSPSVAFSGTFRYDAVVMQVASTNPANGAGVALPLTSIDVTFNEPYAVASIGASDLVLSQGSVLGAAVVNATTARYTVSGLNTEGVITISMAAGAVTDTFGNPMQAYSGNFTTDFGTVPFTTPLTAKLPAGSLIYSGQTSSIIGPSGDIDSFTLDLEAGQTLALIVTPAATLHPTIELRDSSNTLLASASAAGAGKPALIQLATIATAGTYTIVVAGAAGTTGTATVQAFLNAAAEAERFAGAANDTIATAQNLDAAFIALAAGGQRAAVLGTSVAASATDYYSFTLGGGDTTTLALKGQTTGAMTLRLFDAAGNQLALGTTTATNLDSAIANFVAPVTGTYYAQIIGSAGNEYALLATRNAAFDLESNNTLATAQNLGSGRVVFGSTGAGTGLGRLYVYENAGTIKELDPVTGTVLRTFTAPTTTSPGPDFGLATTPTSLLAGGISSAPIYELDPTTGATLRTIANPGIGISGLAFMNNEIFALTDQTSGQITVFDYITGAVKRTITASGVAEALGASSTTLYGSNGTSALYRIDPLTGASTLLTNLSSSSNIEGVGVVGNELYVNSGNAVQVYDLTTLVFKRAFASGISNMEGVGADGGQTPDDDFFRITLSAGQSIRISTRTPGDAPGEFANTLNPALDLYDPSGTKVASNDNSAPDGRNAIINFTATAAGTYTIKVSATSGTRGEYVLSLGDGLTVSLPVDVTEGGAPVNGTLTVSAAPATDLTVSLVSSDPSRLSVPATLVIPAGQTSVPLTLTIHDNGLLDGLQAITITATAGGYASGISAVNVHDDETATLSINLPASATEGVGIIGGTIVSTAAPTRDLVIQLASSLPGRAGVPATVTLKAGETSAAFNLTVVNDTIINGTQLANITAAIDGWTNGSADVSVQDNDAYILVTLPTSGWEGQTLTNTGTVTIGGTLTSPLVVTLGSSDTTELTLPSTVTIAAGQTSATFTVTLPTDALKDGSQTAFATASASGLTTGTSGNITVKDANLDHLVFDTIISPKIANVAFSVTARAFNSSNEAISVFAGSATLTATGTGGSLPVSPTSATFVAGVWTGNVAVNDVDPAIVLHLNAGGTLADSNSFAINSGTLASFQWSTITSPQSQTPFGVTVTAKDANGFTVTNYNGTATLSGLVGTGLGSSLAITEAFCGSPDFIEFTNVSSVPLNIGGWQVYIYDVEFYPSPRPTVFTFPAGTTIPAGGVFVLEEFGAGPGSYPSFFTGENINWTSSSTSSVAVMLRNSSAQIVDFFAAASAVPSSITSPTTVPTSQWSGAQATGTSSDSFTYTRTGTSDHNNATDWVLVTPTKGTKNTTLTIPFPGGANPVSITPTSVTFVNGVWTGSITVLQAATNMYLRADDGSAHIGDSNTFNVTGPAAPLAPDLLDASDSGILATDNITNFNNSTPAKALVFQVAGTIAGATVTIYANGVAIGSATASGATTTVTTNGTTVLTGGEYSFTARQTVPGEGQSANSAPLAATIDTTAPATPTAPDLQTASDTGVLTTDNITSNKTPAFTVAGAPYFRFARNGTQISGDYQTGTSYVLPTQSDGTAGYSVAAVDAAGNSSAYSTSLNVTVDSVAPRIISSSIQTGASALPPNSFDSGGLDSTGEPLPAGFAPGGFTYSVTFSEAMPTTTLDVTDFALLGVVKNVTYTPATFAYSAGNTVLTLTYSNLPEDSYVLTLLSADNRFEDPAGNDLDGEPNFPTPPNPSGNGTPGGNFVLNFSTDITTQAFPTPLTPKLPLGSLIYDPTVSGVIGSASDTDNFTLSLDAGQTLTLFADPSAPLTPTLSLIDPGGNVIATSTVVSVGKDAVIQSAPITVAGTYTITIGSAGGTIGAYTLSAILNAGVEMESHDGPVNGTRASAENIDGTFISLGGSALRGAVLGTTDLSPGTDFYSFSATAGETVLLGYKNLTGTSLPNVTLQDTAGTTLASVAGAATNLDRFLSFTIPATGTYYVSIAGVTTANNYSLLVLRNAAFDAESNDTSATAQNLGTNRTVLGSISGSGGTPSTLSSTGSGWWNDLGSHTATNTNYVAGFGASRDHRDFFVFNLAGITQNITGAQLSIANPSNGYSSPDASEGLSYFDVSTAIATLIANGTGQTAIYTDLGSGVNFGSRTVSAADQGTQVITTLNSSAIAALNAARGSQFAIGGALTTRGTATTEWMFAFSDGGLTKQLILTFGESADWYSVNVNGTTGNMMFTTSTPGDGPGQFVNALNPRIELYDPAGNLVASGAALSDGRNERINYQPLTTGTYRIKVTADASSTGEYVLAYNRTPRAINDSAEVFEDQSVTVSPVANDVDLDGDALVITGTTNASHGSVTVNADKTILYTPDDDYFGPDSFTYTINDGNGGASTATVNIEVQPVNDAPSFVVGSDQNVLEDSAAQSVTDWATAISFGPANETGQEVDFIVTNDNNDLFDAQPSIAADGTLTFTPAADANGIATVTVKLHDDGGVDDGGVNLSAIKTFTITIKPVNDAPTFVGGEDLSGDEDADQKLAWASGMSAGPANESGQTVHFVVTNDNNDLFAEQPAIDAGSGTLTYIPTANASGSAIVTVELVDDGGTDDGGDDTSVTHTFTITVNAVADIPSLTVDSATGKEASAIALPISAELGDVDGSESLMIEISGVPTTATLSAGINGGGGVWTLTPAQLAGLKLTNPDNLTFTLSVKATATESENGDSAEQTVSLPVVINNVKPIVLSGGLAEVARGQKVVFLFAATDISSSDRAAGFVYVINWGDGTPLTTIPRAAGNGAGVSAEHVFPVAGNYVISVTAYDKDGTVSDRVSKNLKVSAFVTAPDPANTSRTALFIGGTEADDNIQLLNSPGGKVEVKVNGISQGIFAPTGQIFVFAQGGNDSVTVDATVASPTQIYGGDGNDSLSAGGGSAILFGGAGSDHLSGGGGRSILIGGAGADQLAAFSGEDILIGGTTAYESFPSNQAALTAIRGAWTGASNYATRVAQVSSGVGAGAAFRLSSATVFNDSMIDTLKGGSGNDWFIASNDDKISGRNASEVLHLV